MLPIHATYGALLLGGLSASILSGMVALQVVIYFKMYESDRRRIKTLVLGIWFLDMLHTALVWIGLWSYFISNFGNFAQISNVYWSMSISVVVTGISTFVVHCFFSHRIYMLSRHNWFLVVPIVLLALLRLISATVSTVELISIVSLPGFEARFGWVFTLGLSLSTAVDILITGSLCFLLKAKRSANFNVNALIDTLILYAFETGALTAAGTIITMAFWLTQNDNLIFMGLHFVIAKLYANSILVTLNARQDLSRSRSTISPRDKQFGIQIADSSQKSVHTGIQLSSKCSSGSGSLSANRSPKVTINIEHSVHCENPV